MIKDRERVMGSYLGDATLEDESTNVRYDLNSKKEKGNV